MRECWERERWGGEKKGEGEEAEEKEEKEEEEGGRTAVERSPITRERAGRSCAWIHLSGAEIKTTECSTARLTPPACRSKSHQRGGEGLRAEPRR